jgi:predicted DCC family thiol-disulfide oxidoreductase YuxK
MRRLTVLYDPSCELCRRCHHWLSAEPALVELEFLGRDSAAARERFGRMEAAPDELVVVSDEGEVYRGPNAFIMCLYALRDYRAWAFRLADPAMQPLARRALDWLSHNRKRIGRWVPGSDDELLADALAEGSPGCADGSCGTGAAGPG